MKLHDIENEILLALRAGPHSAEQLLRRISRNYAQAVIRLQNKGLITQLGKGGTHTSRYAITDKGLKALTPRNPASLKPRPTPRQGDNVRGPTPQTMRTAPSLNYEITPHHDSL